MRVLVDQSRPEHKRHAQVETVNVLSDYFSEADESEKEMARAARTWLLLLGALSDHLPWVRATALNGINEMANVLRHDFDRGLVESAYVPVAQCLRDPVAQVRQEACSALMSCSSVMDSATADWAVRSVGALLGDPVPQVRAEAIRYLAEDSIQAAAEFLPWAYQWLGDPHPEVRAGALSAIWSMHLSGQRATPPDVPGRVAHLLLTDPDATVREQAADTLAKVAIHEPWAVDALVKALGDPEEDVRHKVIFSLGDYEGRADRAAGPLLTLADGEHREAVGFALRAIGTPTAIDALRRTGLPLEDPDE